MTMQLVSAALAVFILSTFSCRAKDKNFNADSNVNQKPSGDSLPPNEKEAVKIDFNVNITGVPNLDRDSGLGVDFDGPLSPMENDLVTWEFPPEQLSILGDEDSLSLTLTDKADLIRVWHDGKLILGKGADKSFILKKTASFEIKIEFGAYNINEQLNFEHINKNNEKIGLGKVIMQSSPLILNHHLQPSEHAFALATTGNEALISAFKAILGDKFTALSSVKYKDDVWVQDEIEFATATSANGQRQDVIIDSIRDRGLKSLAASLAKPDDVIQIKGVPSRATTFDSFGNLEASPPVKVNGVNYPFGRIYYGSNGKRSQGLSPDLVTFLETQTIQKPFAIDTTWLCVGHVDEFSSFVPDPSSPKGFKLLISDVREAYRLLESMPATTGLPKYAQDFGYATVDSILKDAALKSVNDTLQANVLDSIVETFKKELGLAEIDIIRIPGLFENDACGDGTHGALIPGMVNLAVVNDSNGITNLLVPDPFVRAAVNDQSTDPFIKKFAELMPNNLKLNFVDDWDVYHLAMGEIHCGSNVRRKPIAEWWKTENPITIADKRK